MHASEWQQHRHQQQQKQGHGTHQTPAAELQPLHLSGNAQVEPASGYGFSVQLAADRLESYR